MRHTCRPWRDPSIHLSPPPWLREKWAGGDWHSFGRSDRGLFVRFAVIFGLLVLLACGVLAVLAVVVMLSFRPMSPHQGRPFQLIVPLIGVVVLLAIAFKLVSAVATRRYTAPLSDTIKAADALAAGDLSARVAVDPQGSGEFHHLAHSFNHMAEALQTADRQRRELLADVAHELRTPLTIIQGNLEGLRDGVYQPSSEHLDLVLDETLKLGRLVDDLRLLTLVEAGQLSLDLQALDVPQLLADARDAFACQANESGVGLAVDVVEPLPPLLADPQRLGQVLGNLIANALRHTPRGGRVTCGASLASLGYSPKRDLRGLWLWVTDTGEGIPAADLPHIFDRFWRGDPARSHESGAGSGLGLAIVKSLIEAHGGTIWADSELDQGTTISFLLPLPPASPPHPSDEAAA
jgi:signal transduction histidine kinase